MANTVQGTLIFDHGMPAGAVTLRLYNVGFSGTANQLTEVKSDASGKYALSYAPPAGTSLNLQVRAVDASGKETVVSSTQFGADAAESLDLVVPSSLQPLAAEFDRLSADMRPIGGIAKLASAQENDTQQDLTLLNQSTNWDSRILALASQAVQQAASTGLGQDVLFALYRVGLPTDPATLASVPADSIQKALQKAADAGIVNMNAAQVKAATDVFSTFSTKTLLSAAAPGASSTFQDLLSSQVRDAQQQTSFAKLFFSQPNGGADLWAKAAQAGVPSAAIDSLRLQGKFLHLTFNNAALSQKLQQDIGSSANLAQLTDKDYHKPATWQATLTALAGPGGDRALDALVPAAYTGATPADRAAAYAGDLARKVRLSFPTHTVARMIEAGDLAVDHATAGSVTTFLRSAASQGYDLGRTPLNKFLATAKNVPALDAASLRSVKTLHRLYQVTPSSESLQAAVKAGLSSSREIASYTEHDFVQKYAKLFPDGEARQVHRRAQTVSSVTFNVFTMAKALETSAPVYSLSSPPAARQNAKNALVQQFPSMASMFGNIDFCQCDDCGSVLSPAAYFVDLLDLLGQHSTPNAAGNTPLDVLIGKPGGIAGRRPDLGALPLTCSNTNTALPYIDLVNEVFEYYIHNNNALDGGVAYDTGSAATEDLIAEPQHIFNSVYSTTLKQAVYPLNLPFDLWIETVRGFLNYFKTTLAQVLDTMRPADRLELFTGVPATPYYRAQILAESAGISPAEYAVFTATDTANWFKLYGYTTEAAALSELKSAQTLSQKLGITYQSLVELVKTGFFNPKLYPLLYSFDHFGIDFSTALRFTNQPLPAGTPALTADETTAFQNVLAALTARYKAVNPNSNFNATAWLNQMLPAQASKGILVLADPNSGCNFAATTLQYADGSVATALDFLKLNLFVRLCNKLGCDLQDGAGEAIGDSGWSLEEIDHSLQAFFPGGLPAFTDATFAKSFGDSWKTTLVYLAHLDECNRSLAPARGRIALLPLWSRLPVTGEDPLYAQLFLTSSVLTTDFAFDDPNGQFPVPATDLPAALQPLSAHAAAIQGALGLTFAEIDAILADAAVAAPAAFTLDNMSICYRYSALAQLLEIPVADLIALKTMSGLNPFSALPAAPLKVLNDDLLQTQTLAFLKQVALVQNSGFSVEDLNYLLRDQFDPVGQYQRDPNTQLALMQSVAAALRQIAAQNAVPPDWISMPETLIDQKLSGLIPAPILKTLFAHLTNTQTYTATTGSALALTPADFAGAAELALSFDVVKNEQSVSCMGLLTDWRKAELQKMNQNPALAATLTALLNGLQQQAKAGFNQSIASVVGVWASMVQYEAAAAGIAAGQAIVDPGGKLVQTDPSLTFSYDSVAQVQRLAYRGVLTDAKLNALTAVNNSPVLLGLLQAVQKQTLPAYTELTGTLVAAWCNSQTSQASQGGVVPASQIDAAAFAAALASAQQGGAITDPVPAIQFHYDDAAQVQTLSCAGVLTSVMQGKLTALIASPVLAAVLGAVRTQAVNQFQSLASGLLPAAVNNPDPYISSFSGVDASRQQRYAKAELMRVFLPLAAQKLSSQLVIQTMSATLGAASNVIEALVTDAALLCDLLNPGKSLLPSLVGVGTAGVTASYFNAANALLATSLAATADTTDPSNSVAGTVRARFEGYLQVSTDGPYRFFAKLGDAGAKVNFGLSSLDPSAQAPGDSILQATAAAAGDEVSEFVTLTAGIAYPFTIEFSSLGAGGASLLVQGEALAKGPLSQIALYSTAAVAAFNLAGVLLSKISQILQVTNLSLREIRYLVAAGSVRLSALPTRSSDDTAAKAAALFAQFLTLADYADLRGPKGPAGGTDGLIDVFLANALPAPATPPATILANLTRRDHQLVQDVAAALGPDPHFADGRGIRRMWDALQLIQILGLPVTAVAASTAIATGAPTTPELIAANFKNAVKAQYTPEQWRPIAQSVFDPLRKRKRDSLVSYLLNSLGLASSNQLFEYFLIDPGNEPVVQTSRLRLALSSVQTFVQRCFLNFENGNADAARNVSPSAIPADWWAWMKRYRVWQANREIFLFPENWMEPELRLDKTDLFQNLESALLQGDVTRDLVEDGFLDYLKGLDLRARLDIVATYLDQDMTNPGVSTLHVLGRTYGHPHKFFYRTYSTGTWSGWVAVTPDIESDHVALAIWRGRLNLFWVTFLTRSKAADSGGGDGAKGVGNLPFGQLFSDIAGSKPQTQVQLQLHWSEYVQGKWTNRISSDVNRFIPIDVDDPFSPRDVHIHVSKEMINGVEGAIRIHVDLSTIELIRAGGGGRAGGVNERLLNYGRVFPIHIPGFAFRVTSKNCEPDFSSNYYQPAPPMPYNTTGVDATFFTGSESLSATFETHIQANGQSQAKTEGILKAVQNFDVLSCANPVSPPFLEAANSTAYFEAGGLVSPFFFKDTAHPGATAAGPFKDERTFYVQPSLTETVMSEWDGWAIAAAAPPEAWVDLNALDQLKVTAQVPLGPAPPLAIDPGRSILQVQPRVDWVTRPDVAVSFSNSVVGSQGRIAEATAPAVSLSAAASSVGSQPGAAATVPSGVLTIPATGSGLSANIAQKIAVVGSQGANLNQIKTVQSRLGNLGRIVNR